MALLRGVNVSGQRRILMADLRRSLEDLGLRRVRTYLQSGNVVFEVPEDFAADPDERMAASGCAANPFAGRPGVDEKSLHVTLLLGPEAGEARNLEPPVAAGEHLVLAGRVVYLLLPHGYGRTKLNNAYFEKALGTGATTRNWRTVLALRELSS